MAAVLVAAGCASSAASLARPADSAQPALTSTTGTAPATVPDTTVAPAPTATAPEPAPAPTEVPVPAEPTAPETTLPPPPPPPPPPPAPFADQVRALLPAGIDDRLRDWTVLWKPSRPGYLAITYAATRTIDVHVRPGRSAALTAFDLAHEYGHALDLTYLNGVTRQQWGERRGLDTSSWFGCNMCTDFGTPAGDWAESVASCLTGNRSMFRSQLGARPTADDCAWISTTVGPW